MAMSFSQVKTITIPEGSVTKITDSAGNILWNKGPSWHTIWEGSVTLENSTSDIEVAKLEALSGTVTLRVTWSSTASGGNDYSMITRYYNNNGSKTTTYKPANPFQFNLNTASDRNYIVGCTRLSNTEELNWNTGRICFLSWNHASKSFRLNGDVGGHGASDVDLSMTVTKIEQYS